MKEFLSKTLSISEDQQTMIHYIFLTDFRKITSDFIKTYELDEVIKTNFLYLQEQISNYNIEEILQDPSYISNMTMCFLEKMSDLVNIVDCVKEYPLSNIIINPSSLTAVAMGVDYLEDSMRSLNISLMTQFADLIKQSNISTNLRIAAEKLRQNTSSVVTTTPEITTTISSDSVIIKFSPLLVNIFFVLIFAI